MKKLKDGTPVHKNSKPAFKMMLGLIDELSQIKSEASAKKILASFIFVRTMAKKSLKMLDCLVAVSPETLAIIIETLVQSDSEGGKLAQAVTAGLVDVFAGEDCVESGRINDPSRHYPGDVCVRNRENKDIIEKAFEVRDKPVRLSDIHIFGQKCLKLKVREAAVVMVSQTQEQIDTRAVSEWATNLGIGMTLFFGWPELVEQVLFWSKLPKMDAAMLAARQIEKRLISVEASEEALLIWQKSIKCPSDD